MISGPRERRRRELAGSTIASILVHVVVLALLFAFVKSIVMTPAGSGERISETTSLSLQRQVHPKAKPHNKAHPKHRMTSPPTPVLHELARENPSAPSQPPPQRVAINVPRTSTVSKLQHDRTAFAAEVAQLNKGDDPHAIPTIDPAARGSATKDYAFQAGTSPGEDHGNGLITPVRSWQAGGKDCYFARYTFTYPTGAMEDGTIVWPICYDPASDPFHEPPHPMDFPLPMLGYVLPAGTDLPPLEKDAYQRYEAEIAH